MMTGFNTYENIRVWPSVADCPVVKLASLSLLNDVLTSRDSTRVPREAMANRPLVGPRDGEHRLLSA